MMRAWAHREHTCRLGAVGHSQSDRTSGGRRTWIGTKEKRIKCELDASSLGCAADQHSWCEQGEHAMWHKRANVAYPRAQEEVTARNRSTVVPILEMKDHVRREANTCHQGVHATRGEIRELTA
jgi:hypothetical protein